MKDRTESEQEILREIAKLPVEAQRAICWLIQNRKLIKQIVEAGEMSEEEVTEYIRAARKKKDYMMLVMLLYRQREREKPEQEGRQ